MTPSKPAHMTPSKPAHITVEVAYALPNRQCLLVLTIPHGTTAAEAVAQSCIAKWFPELTTGSYTLGIFSKVVSPETILQAQDRVEIYRPLIADPKTARRKRARAEKHQPNPRNNRSTN